jgi:hypothetical protein
MPTRIILKTIPAKYENHPIKSLPLHKISLYIEDIAQNEHVLDNRGNIKKDRCLLTLYSNRFIVVRKSFESIERIRHKHNTQYNEVRGFQTRQQS